MTTDERENHMPKTMNDLKGNPVVLDTPANVKVKGEKAMRKGVTLVRNDDKSVRVKTGKRGRPATLFVDEIESTRALPVKAEKPKPAKKAAAKKAEPAAKAEAKS